VRDKKGGMWMKKMYLTASDVSQVLGVSLGHAYKVVRELDKNLEKQGYIVVAGRISSKYFAERYYGFSEVS